MSRLGARLRLLPVVALTWGTAALVTMIPATAVPAAGVAGVATTAAVIAAARSRRAAAVVALAAIAAFAVAGHVAVTAGTREAAADLVADAGRAAQVSAVVVGKPALRADGAWAFDAITEAAGASGTAVTAPIEVEVTPADIDDTVGHLDVGARIDVRGMAVDPFPGDRAVARFRADGGVTVRAPPSGILAVASQLRRGLVRASSSLPGPGAGLIPGLSVGDTSAVDADLDLAMKASSLSHLTAVSGANCALVVGLAFLGAAALGMGRRTRVMVGLAALAAFVLLVTPEPSVVRAGAMSAIAMLALLLGRRGVGSAILSLAVTLLLILDPWLSTSLGFALSATATASLLLFARPLADGMARMLPRSLAFALSVPLAAQLACGPLLILIEPSVPLYGVVANLLAAPAAPVATVVGLAACLTAPMPWLQDGLTALAWVPASWIAATAETVTTLPGNALAWAEGWWGAAALAGIGLLVGLVIGLRPAATGSTRRIRVVVGGVLATVMGILAGTAVSGSVLGHVALPPGWTVAACDVGQGDAVLVRSADRVMLVDTGPDVDALDRCLRRMGVSHIDILVLTHFDHDHVGGAAAVVGRVGTVIHGPVGERAPALAELSEQGAVITPVAAGDEGALGDARWRVLWPVGESRAFPAGNDTSVVLDVRGGGVPPLLLLGDLSAAPQRMLRASGELRPPYAIVKVAHHGSADQDAALYDLAQARVGVVTVGENDYGHPRQEILEVVQRNGVVARTDLDGIVIITPDDGRLSVWRERGTSPRRRRR